MPIKYSCQCVMILNGSMIKLFPSRVLILVPGFGYKDISILDNVLSPNVKQNLSKT